jgi:hypothetical protein
MSDVPYESVDDFAAPSALARAQDVSTTVPQALSFRSARRYEVNVCFGSLADILTSPRHVRFTPITDVGPRIQGCIWLSGQAKAR